MDNFLPGLITSITGSFCGAYFAFKLARKSAKENDIAILEVNSSLLMYDVAQHIRVLKQANDGNYVALNFIASYSFEAFNQLKSKLPGIEKNDLEKILIHFNNIFLIQSAVKMLEPPITAKEIPTLPQILLNANSAYEALNKHAKVTISPP